MLVKIVADTTERVRPKGPTSGVVYKSLIEIAPSTGHKLMYACEVAVRANKSKPSGMRDQSALGGNALTFFLRVPILCGACRAFVRLAVLILGAINPD